MKNFITLIEDIKKKGELDISAGEDLSIALMNLISLEEHFSFSYMKTEEEKYLNFLEKVREVRKELMNKIVSKEEKDYSEKWCISKHLLASSMRLMETGTKCLHDDKKEEAKDMMVKAFDLYSIFWALNGSNMLKAPASKSRLSEISNMMKKLIDCCKE